MIFIIILLCDVTAPHQPRLDYQMWFAARAHYKHNHWILNLVYRLLTQQTEGLSLYRTRRHTFYNNKLITIIISQTTTMFCLMNVSGRSTYLSVHCRWQSVSCRSRSSVEQSSIACHFCPLSPYFAVVLNHISSHFLVPLSDSSLICTVLAQSLVIWGAVV